MPTNSRTKILFDANVIIDLHRFSLWNQVVNACHVTVTPIIKREARFFKDMNGVKQSVNLDSDIKAKKIEELAVSIDEFSLLNTILNPQFLRSIDEGEWEAIAFF